MGITLGVLLSCVDEPVYNGVKFLNVECKFVCAMMLDKLYFKLDTDIIIIGCYFPPFGSTSYAEEEDGMAILEEIIVTLKNEQNAELVILGDLNAHTALLPNYIFNDDVTIFRY